MSRIRSSSRIRSTCSRRRWPSWCARSGTRATRAFRRPASRSRTYTRAPAPATGGPGPWSSISISASPPRAATPRCPPEGSGASPADRVESILRKHALDFSIQWTLGAKPFLSRRGRLADIVLQVAKRRTGHSGELSTTGGTSDARFIIDICPEVIELGPVNTSIHKLNEHIALQELEALPLIYLDTL